MNFGHALANLNVPGQRVTRDAWQPTLWLVLVPGSVITVAEDRPLGAAAPDLVGQRVTYQPHIDLYQAGVLAPWTPTHADLLADDWRVLDGGLTDTDRQAARARAECR